MNHFPFVIILHWKYLLKILYQNLYQNNKFPHLTFSDYVTTKIFLLKLFTCTVRIYKSVHLLVDNKILAGYSLSQLTFPILCRAISTANSFSHCQQLNGPLHEHISTTYGVTKDSIPNSSRFFHVCDGLVPDIMHDILEGSLQYEVKELLKHLIYS